MSFALGQDWAFCFAGDRIVLMDIKRDTYLLLSPDLEGALRQLISNPDGIGIARPSLQRLFDRGIIRMGRDQEGVLPARLDERPARSAMAEVSDRPVFPLAAILSLLDARRAVRRVPFSRIIGAMRSGKNRAVSHAAPDADDLIAEIVSNFACAARFSRSFDQCLPRSLAMAKALFRRNVPVSLVVGVALRPFAAHCWVQYGDVVLNDRVEVVRDYQPILVI